MGIRWSCKLIPIIEFVVWWQAFKLESMMCLQAMNRKKGAPDMQGFGGGGMNSMMSQMQGMMGEGSRPGASSMMAGSNMMKESGSNMTEDEYVRVWENYSKQTGQPFNAQTVRGWYRTHKKDSMGQR